MPIFDPDPPAEQPHAHPRAKKAGKTPKSARERKAPKPPKPITEDGLRRAALRYLERYASSAENLRRVLRRKVRRACLHHGTAPEAHEPAIETVIAACLRVGHVEDARYAEMRAETLRRRGLSRRMILSRLAGKGVAPDTALAALERVDAEAHGDRDGEVDEDADGDVTAARAFARRRRLGPYRPGGLDEARRDRDMAALARGGFTFEIARTIIDSPREGDS